MKKKLQIRYDACRTVEREVDYIPVRYILALPLHRVHCGGFCGYL